ncbi:MAG: hypothetical protein JNL06_03630 [Alphaproteobacteria bacterium]|nr:hypothetical protein [Alphaproteobacteria bacterium]
MQTRPMLTVVFALATVALIASVFRPPRTLAQRAAVALAAVVMLAVLIAWGIEFVMQTRV